MEKCQAFIFLATRLSDSVFGLKIRIISIFNPSILTTYEPHPRSFFTFLVYMLDICIWDIIIFCIFRSWIGVQPPVWVRRVGRRRDGGPRQAVEDRTSQVKYSSRYRNS